LVTRLTCFAQPRTPAPEYTPPEETHDDFDGPATDRSPNLDPLYPSTPLVGALYCIESGLAVLPLHDVTNGSCSCPAGAACDSPGKHPRTRHGVNDASLDLSQVHDWWTRTPNANVGIATGKVSGIFVLDVDPRNGGDESLGALVELHGPLPQTVRCKTGGGGEHYYFTYEPGLACKASFMPGLDIKSDGGYVVAPPSGHASGGKYEWDADGHPDDVPLSAAPPWLLNAISGRDKGTSPAVRSDGGENKLLPEQLPEGTRHDGMFRLACSLRSKGLGPEAIEAALLAENNVRCTPPLPEDEVKGIALSAAHYPLGHSADSADSAEPIWEPPVLLDAEEYAEPFPVDALPPALRDWALAEAEATQTPVDLPAALAMAVLSLALAKKVEVEVRPGWNEPVNLYWAVAMESGSCKSSVFRHALAPVVEYERKLQAAYSPTAAQSQRDVLKKAHDKAIAEAAKADGGDHPLNEKVQELARKLDALPRVAVPRLKADDVTAEKLGVLLDEQGGRIGVFSAETSIFEIMAGRYSDGQGKFEIFLSGHAGDDVAVDRVGRPALIVHNPAITMGVCVQPSVIRNLGRADFKDKGLLGRFFYCLPVSKVGSRKVDPPPVSQTISEEYRKLLLNLLEFPAKQEEGRFIPRVISPDAAALKALLDFKQRLEPRLGPDGDLEQLRSWGSKLAGAIARIAGLFQVVDDQRAREITLPVMPEFEDFLRLRAPGLSDFAGLAGSEARKA
jgi:hypothetical protein